MDSKPVYVFRELTHYLAAQRIVSPAYSVMQDIVGKALSAEQNRLTAILALSVKRRNFGRQGIYPLPHKHLWALSENER